MKQAIKSKFSILLLSTGLVFLLLVLTMLLSNIVTFIFIELDWIKGKPAAPLLPFLVQNGVISIFVGTILTLCIGYFPLRPIHTLIQAIHDVSEGKFDTKVQLGNLKEFRKLADCFNQMTDDLSSIEMLRADFINNFSHEFKTPIVSIMGFAKLLKKGNLTEEEKAEYLDIIISESNRLTVLSNNVLNLSKIDTISALSDVTTFNVSEQIRESILLLERKWTAKNLSLDMDMEELEITGSPQLLKQVWVNLIDNAVKFSPPGSPLKISLDKKKDCLVFRIKDNGPGIDSQTRKYIFDKFYQGDTSHSTEGNGLGLSLVKKIVTLHHGSVSVRNLPEKGCIFTVSIPQVNHP